MRIDNEDYISLTDLAKYKNKNDPSDVIKKWLSNYDTIEFLGLWEELSNENFNSAEFSLIKTEAPKKSFIMTPSKWVTTTNAIGMTFSKGKYSVGTFAHSDIALEFASWMDNLFKIYLIKEFIVPKLTEKQKIFVYAEEADVINVALFGMTAKEWHKNNPNLEGNIRDYIDILYLVILSNLEVLNSNMIEDGILQKERLEKLNNTARRELEIFSNDKNIKKINDNGNVLKTR